MSALERLERVRQAGPGRWLAACPAHDDDVCSLSVRAVADGLLVHCFAGCEYRSIVAALQLEAAAGGTVEVRHGAIVIHPAAGQRQAGELAGSARRASVLDAEGVAKARARLARNPLALALAWRAKGWTRGGLAAAGVGWQAGRFVFASVTDTGAVASAVRYRPGGRPKMLGSMRERRMPWPHPSTLSGPVVLVEGEPDAATLIGQLGLPAVAVPGAGACREDDAAVIAERCGRVLVVADCDGPGRACAERMAGLLERAGAGVAVLDLDPWRWDGWDVSDAYLAALAAGDAEGLRWRLLEAAA